MTNWLDKLFFLKDQEGDDSSSFGPSWKYRRKLIYGSYRIGVLMILFGMITFVWDREVSVQLVVGGVALLSIILTAYTASATFEDVKLWKHDDNNKEEEI